MHRLVQAPVLATFAAHALAGIASAQCPRDELPLQGNVAMDAGVLAVASSSTVHLFDSTSGAPLGSIPGYGGALALDAGVLAVGSTFANSGRGAVYLLDVTTGALLHTIVRAGGEVGDDFGRDVDLHAGRLVVGAPFEDDGSLNTGGAHVYDVATGQRLFDLKASTASSEDLFGWSVAIHGATVLVGAPLDQDLGTETGSVHAFDSATGQLLAVWTSADLSARRLGSAVAVDGTRAVLGGKWGGVRVRDLATGQETAAIDLPHEGQKAQAEVAAIALDGDLALVGLPYDALAGGSAHLIDLSSGAVVDSLYRAGKQVFMGGSVALDGGELAVSGGTKEVTYRYAVCAPIGTSYCGPAVPNSTGVAATIAARGSDSATANDFTLLAESLPPARQVLLLASRTQGFVPNVGGGQGTLCLGGPFARFVDGVGQSTGAGTFALRLDLSAIPLAPPVMVVAGETWNFQAWYRDKNPTGTSNLTDGVSVLFQ